MKKFSKILSVALLVALVLSLGITSAFAEETEPQAPAADPPTSVNPKDYTIAIKNSVEGFAYEAYQIFTGDLSQDGTKLSNIEWGSGISDAGIAALYDKYNLTTDADKTAAKVAEKIAAAGNVADDIATFLAKPPEDEAERLDSGAAIDLTYAKNIKIGEEAAFDGYYVDDQDTGWYLVVNTAIPANSNYTYSDYIVKVVNNVAVAPKSSTTTTDKKVKDINDSLDENFDDIEWADSADHDIYDIIPFQLSATICADYDNYNTYYFAFHDEESDGLTFLRNSVKVYVDNNEIEDGFTVITNKSQFDDNCTFEVIFDDLKTIDAVHGGSVITVEYESQLNENAVIGNPGNPNKMYGEFSNNPNAGGTGKTTPKTVVVFTYTMDVDKIAKNGEGTAFEPKTGAGFTLYKQYAAADTNQVNMAKSLGKPTTEFWYAVGPEVKGESMTNFVFEGLDDGNYILVETTTPDGYNTMANLVFTITAIHGPDGESVTGYSVSELTGPDGFATSPSGGAIEFTRPKADGSEDETVTTKIDGETDTLEAGEIYGQIINQSGVQLPSTGGIGTTIFYAVGGILVLAAIVLLITKKRMSD